jgi:hypothetical protein
MTDITVTPNFQAKTPLTPEQRKQRTEQAAVGVGGAAGVVKTSERHLQRMMEQTRRTMQTVDKNAKAANGLWSSFKSDIKFYTQEFVKGLESLKGKKIIGPILNSPVTKKLAGAAGGAMAFFVLITGVNKAVNTGAIAIDDFKNQYHDFKAYA